MKIKYVIKSINKKITWRVEHQEMRIFPNPIEERDRDKSFMIKLLDVILDKIRWIGDKYPSNIKSLQEIKASFYEETPHGR